jgi:trans-aconitate methyltransferase
MYVLAHERQWVEHGGGGPMTNVFTQGDAYERFMGRWSRLVAPRFLSWLDPAPRMRWADLGCGTGALTAAVLEHASPGSVLGVDPSQGQVDEARRQVTDTRARFETGSAGSLPAESFDVVVSGLVLNFVPDPVAAVAAMSRALVGGGTVAAYVWDYAVGMQLLRTFWDVAVARDPAVADLHEGHRFELPGPEALANVWEEAGLRDVTSTSLTVPTVFEDFEDYWQPFLGGQGPGPAYVASLGPADRKELRAALARALPTERDGRIVLSARAWAVRGVTSDVIAT